MRHGGVDYVRGSHTAAAMDRNSYKRHIQREAKIGNGIQFSWSDSKRYRRIQMVTFPNTHRRIVGNLSGPQ